MSNNKHPLEKLAELVNKNSELNKAEVKVNTANILKRSNTKSDLKYDVLSCLFLYMENHNLGIDAVYEVLTDIRTELNCEFNAKYQIDYDDEIPF
ncbi:hypothetical protein [Providencia sp.]|uniref:hypothetical protein n=1 Tax=Providencia sp. TaxID=589 RepID=UPI00333FA563